MPSNDPLYAVAQRLAHSPAGRLLRNGPAPLRLGARAALELPVWARLVRDPRSLARVMPKAAPAPASGARAVRLRRFGRLPVTLRPGSADVAVVRNMLLTEPHLPPAGTLRGEPRLVWDLGAHIGVAALDYATRWPSARVVAVELMPENAALCRRNLAPFGDRCEVVEGAVWSQDGEVSIVLPDAGDVDTNAFSAGTNGGGSARSMPAIALDTLLAREPEGARVDLCKLDVEGAEQRVLTEHTDWATRVDVLVVEVHGDYTREACTADLERLGFDRVVPGAEANLLVATRS